RFGCIVLGWGARRGCRGVRSAVAGRRESVGFEKDRGALDGYDVPARDLAASRHRAFATSRRTIGLALLPEAHERRSPSRVQEVCVQPAMDGRRPACCSWTRTPPG